MVIKETSDAIYLMGVAEDTKRTTLYLIVLGEEGDKGRSAELVRLDGLTASSNWQLVKHIDFGNDDLNKVKQILYKTFISDTTAKTMFNRYAGVVSGRVISNTRRAFVNSSKLKGGFINNHFGTYDEKKLKEEFEKRISDTSSFLYNHVKSALTDIHKSYARKTIWNLWGLL